ncbi:MAG: ABC transporter ATP-binding protein [Candidatus Zixiibacteriota bacterium]
MIKVKNLVKTFGEVEAVRNISFDVESGEVVGFLGPNGAGKTTTMRMITSFLTPNNGDVIIDGESVVEESIKTRSRIGYLPEDAPVYEDMEVLEYLEFVAEMRDIPDSVVKQRIKDIAKVCGISKVMYRGIGELSKGFRQRVGLAQALIHNPDILILDEPTSGLDPNQIVEIRDLIKQIGEKRTVILSTHILSEVQATCDRALIINNGEIVADGTIDQLQNRVSNEIKYRIEIDGPTADVRNMLENLDGIFEIVKLDKAPKENAHFAFKTLGDRDPRAEIFNKAVEQKWVLLQMSMEKIGLEDVFRQLTMQSERNEQ